MKKLPDKVIKVGIVYNAFDPTDVKKAELAYRKNTKLKTYLADLPTDCDWKIGVNGVPVDLEKDGNRRLKANDLITLVVVPHGHGGFKSILRAVAMLAIVVAAAYFLGPGGLELTGWALAGAVGLASIAGSLLVNALIPPPAPKMANGDPESYGYDGAKNTSKQGVALPVVYGQYRVAGNYVDLYTQNSGNDQYLYARTVLSDGEIESVSDPLIDDQPVSNYTNIDYGFTLGTADQALLPYFNRNITQVQKSVKLVGSPTAAFTVHSTTTEVDQFQIDLQFTRGILAVGDTGKKHPWTVNFEAEYSEAGMNNWRPLGSAHLVKTNGAPSTPTPSTDKLAVTVAPVLTGDGFSIPYEYQVQYRPSGASNWITFKDVQDTSTSRAYTLNSGGPIDWTQLNAVQSVQYQQQLNQHSYEWQVPQGIYEIRVTGQGTIVDYSYRVASGGSSTFSFTDQTTTVLRRTISSGLLDLGFYDIRIRKLTYEGDQEHTIDECYLTDIGEITTTPVAFNNIAYGWYAIKMTEQLSNIPNLTFLVKGVKVNQYDVSGNVVQKAWTANPAWICLDMLISPERGAPGIYAIDYPAFYEWAQYCDAQNLEYNAVFDTTMTLWDACSQVLRVGHAAFTRVGNKMSIAIDNESDPVMLFGPGNIFKDSFKIDYLAMTDRANEFEVSYFDRDDGNKQKTIRIVDPDADNRGDLPRAVSYDLVGIDNFQQALNEAWYQLYSNRYLRRTITFDAPIESIGLGLGDVALIQHDMMDWGFSGRLGMGSTQTTIKLDKKIEMEDGNTYTFLVCHIDSDVIEERDCILDDSGPIDTITLVDPLTITPALYSNYMIGVKQIVKKPYRLKSINGTGFDRRTLTFLEYNPAIYAPPENIVPFPPTSGPKTVDHVRNLAYVYDDRSTDANTTVTGTLSWDSSATRNYGGADIYVALNGSGYVFNKSVLNVNSTSLDFRIGDSMSIKVVAFSTTLLRAPIGTAPYITIGIQSGPAYLSPPTNLNVTEVSYLALGLVEASWDAPPAPVDGDTPSQIVYRVQVLNATTSNWDEYGVTNQTTLRVGDLTEGTHQLRVRAERGQSASIYVQEAFLVQKTDQSIDDGATKGAPDGTYVGNTLAQDLISKVNGISTGVFDNSPPGIPTGLTLSTATILDTVTGLNKTVVIAAWNANTESDMSFYDVNISEQGGGFVSFFSASNSYKITVSANATVSVKVRACDHVGNYSGFCAVQTINSAKDNVPPAAPTGLVATAALTSIFLDWNNPADIDLEATQIWSGSTSASGSATLLATVNALPGQPGGFTHSGLTTGTTVYYWVKAVDTSGNTSGFNAATISATTLAAGTADIAVGAITADRVRAGTLTGDRFNTGTSLPGTITVGSTGVSIGTVQSQAADPANTINGKTTLIQPGKVVISGGTTLANWRSGADNTKIEGGNIAANSIVANSLKIGVRGITFEGMDFGIAANQSFVYCLGGHIYYLDDNGLQTVVTVNYFQFSTGGVIYYDKATKSIKTTLDFSLVAGQGDTVQLATWDGPGSANLRVMYGGTIIDGTRITTGTVNADRIIAGTVTATQIAALTIVTNNLQDNSVSQQLGIYVTSQFQGAGTPSGSDPLGGTVGNGSGGTIGSPVGCVRVDTLLPSGKLAGDAVVGDDLLLLNREDDDGYHGEQLQGIRKFWGNCLRITTESGITLVASDSTPITSRNDVTCNITEALGVEVPVLDKGEFRWEHIVSIEPVGMFEVCLISAGDGVYASGEFEDRYIFTHNGKVKY